jgi:aminobenzoyl-glutamate utilization protein B
MHQIIIDSIDKSAADISKLAKDIWDNPEMGWTEFKAVEWTAAVLEKYGFDVEVGAYNMPTAIRATWGSGKPVVGFAAEYDCLPGLSQKVCSHQDPVVPGGIGHGCGHNLLGAGCLGACIGLKAALEKSGKPGTVIFYGCPAEEQMTGKGFMAKAGAFYECDFTYAWHPGTRSRDSFGLMTGVNGFWVNFHGKTAHAAGAPHLGKSALDAAQLMNIGVEFMREHLTDDVRIHYIYTDAGKAPNIVPDTATVKYFVRAIAPETLKDATAKVMECARGAAIMTGTTYDIVHMGALYPTLPNSVLGQAVQDARKIVPLEEYTEEELKFCDEINQTDPAYKPGVTKPISFEDQTPNYDNGFGSTDYGDVEHIRPGFNVSEATAATLSGGHSWKITACSGSSVGMKGMVRAAKLLAIAAFDVMTHPEKLEAANKEFEEKMNGAVYECPIDPSVEWPYKD